MAAGPGNPTRALAAAAEQRAALRAVRQVRWRTAAPVGCAGGLRQGPSPAACPVTGCARAVVRLRARPSLRAADADPTLD